MSMEYSNAALHAFLMKERLRMTNAQCWKRFSTSDDLAQAAREQDARLEALTEEFLFGSSVPGADGILCPFDESYPMLNPFSPVGERPFLLFYQGDRSLLEDLNQNVAVIGTVDLDEETAPREQALVKQLVKKGLTIVSGLAKGCDAAAHEACLEAGGKTIAVLPTHLEKIYPAQNRGLAKRIVEAGGLLLTEYGSAAAGRSESVKRFTDRDRLQALFSKAVILIASCRKGEGDSGSRHAMESARRYRLERYVMFDQDKDEGKPLFGLNQDLLKDGSGVRALRQSLIADLKERKNPALFRETVEQIKLELD